jgi:hypothetical protein
MKNTKINITKTEILSANWAKLSKITLEKDRCFNQTIPTSHLFKPK